MSKKTEEVEEVEEVKIPTLAEINAQSRKTDEAHRGRVARLEGVAAKAVAKEVKVIEKEEALARKKADAKAKAEA